MEESKNAKALKSNSTPPGQEIIKVENLNVTYFKGKPNQVNALTDINLKIYSGEFIVFFGPSGCGKSTLLYAIAGLERNIEGNIFVSGKNLSKFSDKDFDNHRRFVAGMIFQAYHLISSLNVLSNIILPQFGTNNSPKEREAKAMELLKFFGVLEQKKRFPNELSGGQQQRVAICRSLMNDPQIILADEPTGNLDSKSAIDVMNTLLDLNERQNKTIILVTHSPASLNYAHRIFYLKDGKIIDEKVNHPVGSRIDKSALPENVLEADLETGYKPGAKKVKVAESIAKTEFLSPVKAKEIILEALFNINIDDFDRLEKMVVEMILSGSNRRASLEQFLDKNWELGGLNLNKRTAKKLSLKIEQSVALSRPGVGGSSKTDLEGLTRIKHDLMLTQEIKLDDRQKLLFDDLLSRRLSRQIDAKELYYNLIDRHKNGGLGLARGLAKKIVKKVESLILEQL